MKGEQQNKEEYPEGLFYVFSLVSAFKQCVETLQTIKKKNLLIKDPSNLHRIYQVTM